MAAQIYSNSERHEAVKLRPCPRCGREVWTETGVEASPCDSCSEIMLQEVASKAKKG